MPLLAGRQMPEVGVPVQFSPWLHLSQRWQMLERELQQGSLTEESLAPAAVFPQGTQHGEAPPPLAFYLPSKKKLKKILIIFHY